MLTHKQLINPLNEFTKSAAASLYNAVTAKVAVGIVDGHYTEQDVYLYRTQSDVPKRVYSARERSAFDIISSKLLLNKLNTKFTLRDALTLSFNLAKTADRLYGILLGDDKGNFINPFHPILMLGLTDKAKTRPEMLDKMVTPYIFTFSGSYKIAETSETAIKALTENMITLINDHSKKLPISTSTDVSCSLNSLLATIDTVDKLEDVKFSISDRSTSRITDNSYVVIPTTTARLNSLAYPYYGVSYVNTKVLAGYSLTPMTSPNLGEGSWDSGTRSVCTGGVDAHTIKGLLRLNQANFDSAYVSSSICKDYYAWAKMCMEASNAVYNNFLAMTEPKPEPTTENQNQN